MATSVSTLHKEYKKRGGKKSFKEFSTAYMDKKRKSNTPAKKKAATAKANKAKKLVSGKFEKSLRKPLKRKYST